MAHTCFKDVEMFVNANAVSERTLADLQPTECALIERIPSALSTLCSRIGLHEGLRVTGRAISPSVMVVYTDSGCAVIGTDWAQCIDIVTGNGCN